MYTASAVVRLLQALAAFSVDFLGVSASSRGVEHRQRVSPSWTSVGCYTDTASARTLAGATFSSSDTMSVEACIAFCTPDTFIYAGVEFGTQCFCDYAIQNPGTPTTPAECDLACSGNISETCGAANRINVFSNGMEGPSVIPSIDVGSNWVYAGCYTDDASTRTLPHLGAATFLGDPSSEEIVCVALCNSLHFVYAGLEFGTQCWCGNGTGTSQILSGTLAPDSDCHTACAGDLTHSEFCGGRERLTVFHKDICVTSSISHFWLIAFFEPQPPTSPIGRYLVLSAEESGFAVLTANLCDECCGVGIELDMQDRVLTAEGNPVLGALPLRDGESPVFFAGQAPLQNYCSTRATPQSIDLLVGNGRSDVWSLCPNTTAGGRLDVVFGAVANHPHYILSECSLVFVQIIDSPNAC